MVVVGDIVIVTMHRPKQVFDKAMGMAMICDHLDMISNGRCDLRCMV